MAQPELLYYFTPTKYALESVQNRRLKVAELDKTNDPYEMLPIRWHEGLKEPNWKNRLVSYKVSSQNILR